MSKINELAEYLAGDSGFLLNDSNNAKVVMISGEWGAGKTYFWKNRIEPMVSEKLLEGESAYVYVSLYGKESLEDIKSEVLYKAYLFQNSANDLDKLTSKAISVFGVGTRVLSSLSLAGLKFDSSGISESANSAFESRKLQSAEKYINNGGVICFDDFERKSVNIDLNDLFGFLSQLSIEMSCKIVIILNSDIFEGKERNIFKKVKEKTISKYFDYSPKIEELFEVIFHQEKYEALEVHRVTILEVIKETKELNARVYMQVLDNCLEWIGKGNSQSSLRALIISTVNFIKNHFVFEKVTICKGCGKSENEIYEVILKSKNFYEIFIFLIQKLPNLNGSPEEVIHQMRAYINKKDEKENKSTKTTKSDQYYHELNKEFDSNITVYEAIHFYAYNLKLEDGTTNEEFIKINNFLKSGILL